jgi:hypothetical protein
MTLAVNIAQGGSNNVTFRNRIINGACVIDQRNAGGTLTSNNAAYAVDRWNTACTQNTATIGQNYGGVTPPAGFSNYYGLKITSVGTLGVNDYNQIFQVIEGYNIADLNWGSANAKPITFSFWVYSSVTGTWGGSLRNGTLARSYPFSYTISAANTWEQKTITVAGDTSGTWNTTNGAGMYVTFSYGAGSNFSGTAGAWAGTNYNSATGAVSIVTTSNATFYFTGVQLEAGTTASPFEYRQYTTELQLCQRYFEMSYNQGVTPATVTTVGVVWNYLSVTSGTVGDLAVTLQFKVDKRVTPTMVFYSPSTGAAGYFQSVSADVAANIQYAGQHNCAVYGTVSASNAQLRVQYTATAEL